MSDPEKLIGPDAAITEIAGLEPRDQKRANFLLGRLLQVDPEIPVGQQAQRVVEGIDDIKPKGGIPSGSLTGQREIFGRSEHIQDRHGRSFVVLEDIRPGGSFTVFYLSNSHGVWRAALSQAQGGYNAKGMFGAENSADAPLTLQRSLSKMAEEEAVQGDHLMEIIYAIHNDNNQPGGNIYADRLAESTMQLAGISTSPKYSADEILSDDPDEFFVDGKAPDLSDPIEEWESTHPTYGLVQSTAYPAMDGTLHYQVNSAEHNGVQQHWVGTAEVAGASVTSLALLSEFPEIPDEL